jgi:hypothetical protein
MKSAAPWIAAVALLTLCPMVAMSGVVFTSDLDDGTGWTIVADADTSSEFGFDYSPFGIPSAPNGSGTTGLRMAANIADSAAAVISATPDDVQLTLPYMVQVDFWINYNSSGGTTEFIGGFAGFDATVGNPRNGAGLLGDSDGDSARDYRLYKDASEQFVESGQYDIPSNDNSDPVLEAQFPGQTTPAAQGDSNNFDPTNTIVTAPDGTLAYDWHTLLITGNPAAGTANIQIDDLSIGTVDSSVGDAVDVSGGIALTFADLFSSVSTKPEFSFGVFDNLVVTQVPEPSTLALLLGGIGLFLLARRTR